MVFVEPSYFGSPNVGTSVDSLPSDARDIHELHVRPANEPDQKEKAIYYLSKKFTNCEINYIGIEKTCYALVWASHKLR